MEQNHLIEVLLPLKDNDGQAFDPEIYRSLQRDLTEMFGGATAYARSPATGEIRQGVTSLHLSPARSK